MGEIPNRGGAEKHSEIKQKRHPRSAFIDDRYEIKELDSEHPFDEKICFGRAGGNGIHANSLIREF